jgi:MFS transporter, ACS family, hexuronate transporter
MSPVESKIKIRNLRWYAVGMLCVASELNYLDRQTLSVLAQTIQDELRITTIEYSHITTAFLVSYTIMYAVSGRLVDLLGTRRSFLIFVSGWSAANLLHAFARTAMQFSFFRFLLGATEPANFPAGIKAVAEWFPVRERALAVGIFNAGTAIGAALAAPLVTWIALTWGWRYAFVLGGVLGFIWVAVWAFFYRSPRQHPWLTAEESALIASDRDEHEPSARVSVRQLLSIRAVWGCIAVRMLLDPISYFFIFWTPKFLQQERGFDLADLGKYSGIPFVALALGNIVGGMVPRLLSGRGWSVNRSRKTVMLASSCVMPFCCLLITTVTTPALAITLISVAMFLHAAWGFMALPAEIFPKQIIGSVTGFAGMMGGVMGIITQQVIGWTVQNVSFTPVFAACAFMYLAAYGVVCLLVGRLGEIRAVAQVESK